MVISLMSYVCRTAWTMLVGDLTPRSWMNFCSGGLVFSPEVQRLDFYGRPEQALQSSRGVPHAGGVHMKLQLS